jgi:hypothetical protein
MTSGASIGYSAGNVKRRRKTCGRKSEIRFKTRIGNLESCARVRLQEGARRGERRGLLSSPSRVVSDLLLRDPVKGVRSLTKRSDKRSY